MSRSQRTANARLLWVGTFAALAVLVGFAAIPGKEVHDTFAIPPGIIYVLFWKLGHVIGFAIFAGLLVKAITAGQNAHVSNSKGAAEGFIFALFIGVLIEIMQIFIPGRLARLSDVGLDLAGIALGVTIALFASKPNGKKF